MKYKTTIEVKLELPLDFVEGVGELFYMYLTNKERKKTFNYYNMEKVEDTKIKKLISKFINENTLFKGSEKRIIKLLRYNLERRLKEKYDYNFVKIGEYAVQTFYKK